MSIWTEFGFTASPYGTQPIPATAIGERLFVGREEELERLGLLMSSSATHPTIEGENGVGKTSLVAVAAWRAKHAFDKGETQQLLIPVGREFQVTPSETVEGFLRQLYFAVAQAFIDHRKILATRDIPDTSDVRQWLASPILRYSGGGVSAAGFGANRTSGASANTSDGFTEAGFRAAVTGWLASAFPSPEDGAFVCVLDNLELLQTHQAARELLEALRDSAFNVPGLRWVLCGARGIMRSAASSSRLQGVLAEPMTLRPLPDDLVPDVIERRLVYSVRPGATPYVPVEPSGFQHLYEVGNRNLRTALKYAEDYAMWLKLEAEAEKHPTTTDAKLELLEVWMSEIAERSLADTRGVGPRAWEVFDGIVASGGSISPGEFGKFGFGSMQAMRGRMLALEDSLLVESSIDESDKRRRLIAITSRGWIVNYQRSGYKTPRQLREDTGSKA